MNTALFAQLATLGASLTLLLGLILLWRRTLASYIQAFRLQSVVLAAIFLVVAYFTREAELALVAIVLLALKAALLPRWLNRLRLRIGVETEVAPYLNVTTSLLVAGLLALLAYALTRPLVQASALPTRAGLPLAVGLIFIGLFVIITRRKALTQVVGFLVMENGIALLAVLGAYGVPLIIELGVFLDLLMGIIVMQVFIYHIQDTFDSIDVDQLNQLRY
ncbi:MAG: hydrogenase-4 component [Chloroflexota bacterium]|nr:hydrogenase-4 component [Chloroflexota bacterium]